MQCMRISDISPPSVRNSSVHSAPPVPSPVSAVDPSDPSFYLEDTDSAMYDDLAGLLPLPRRGFVARIGRMLKKEVTGHGPPESGLSGVIFLRRGTAPVPQLPPPPRDRERVVRLPRARGIRPVRPARPESVLEPDAELRPPPPPDRVRRWRRMRPAPAPLPTPAPAAPAVPRNGLKYSSRQHAPSLHSPLPPSCDGYSTPTSDEDSAQLDVAVVDVAAAIVDIDSDDETGLHSVRSLSVTLSSGSAAEDVVWQTARSDGSTIKSDATSGVSPNGTQEMCSARRVWETSSRPAWEPAREPVREIRKPQLQRPVVRGGAAAARNGNGYAEEDGERLKFQPRVAYRSGSATHKERFAAGRPMQTGVRQGEQTARKPRWEQMPPRKTDWEGAAPRTGSVRPPSAMDGVGARGVEAAGHARRWGLPPPNQRPLPRTARAERERERARARTDVQEVGMRRDDFVEFQCQRSRGRGRQMRILSNVARFKFGGEGDEDEDEVEERLGEKERKSASVGKAAVSSVVRRARLLQKYS